jgi:hypothetical protein
LSFRSRINRLERRVPHTDPANTWKATPEDRAALVRAVFRRLHRRDPFPSLEGTCYLGAFFPWFRAGGHYSPSMVDSVEEETLALGFLP